MSLKTRKRRTARRKAWITERRATVGGRLGLAFRNLKRASRRSTAAFRAFAKAASELDTIED